MENACLRHYRRSADRALARAGLTDSAVHWTDIDLFALTRMYKLHHSSPSYASMTAACALAVGDELIQVKATGLDWRIVMRNRERLS